MFYTSKKLLFVALSLTMIAVPTTTQAYEFTDIDVSGMSDWEILELEKIELVHYQNEMHIQKIKEAKQAELEEQAKAEQEQKEKEEAEQAEIEAQQSNGPITMAQWENNTFTDVHERANYLADHPNYFPNWNDEQTLLYLQTLSDNLKTSGEMQTQYLLEGGYDDTETEEYSESSNGEIIEQSDYFTIYYKDGMYIVEDETGWISLNSYEEAKQYVDNWTGKFEAEQNGESGSEYYDEYGNPITAEEHYELYGWN